MHAIKLRCFTLDQHAFEVPRKQISTIVNHHCIDLINQEVEPLSVIEASFYPLISNNTGCVLLSFLISTVPNECAINRYQIIQSVVLGGSSVRKRVRKDLTVETIVFPVVAGHHVPTAFGVFFLDAGDNIVDRVSTRRVIDWGGIGQV